jgi:F0F1-type ATP synthase membrane subunit c/vacuolar-type H+-ATPase subunit K
LKSTSINRLSRLSLGLAALGCAAFMGTAVAGVSTNSGKVNAATMEVDAAQESVEERQRPAGDRGELPTSGGFEGGGFHVHSMLKCWQKGQLLFEEKNWRPTAKSLAALPGPVLQSTDGRFDTLHLANFGETFCFLKTRD